MQYVQLRHHVQHKQGLVQQQQGLDGLVQEYVQHGQYVQLGRHEQLE